jgi:hypothetical protein
MIPLPKIEAMGFLAVLAPAALVLDIILLYFFEPPPGAREILFTAMGFLFKMAGDVYGFYFGSSLGSREKDKVQQKGPAA